MTIKRYLVGLFWGLVIYNVAFGQLSLEEAQNMALINNSELKVRRTGLPVAESERFKAGLWTPFNPNFEAEAVSDFLTGKTGEGTYQLSLSQEVELGGQRGFRMKIADSHLSLGQLDVSSYEIQLKTEVRFAYMALLIAQERTAFSRYIEDLSRGLRDTAQGRLLHGFIPSSDFTFLNLDYVSMNAAHNRNEAMLAEAQSLLLALVGLAPNDSIKVGGELTFDPISISEDSAVALAISNRYELMENSLKSNVATAQLSLAKRDKVPNLTLSAFYSRQKSIFTQESIIGVVPGLRGLRDVDHLFGMRLSIPLPIIDRHRSEILLAQSQINYDNAARQSLIQRIRFEARTAYRVLKSSEKTLTSIQQALPSADSVFQLLQSAYSEGRLSVENYLLQKDKLLGIRSDYLDAYTAYSDAQRELERAIGIEWKDIK